MLDIGEGQEIYWDVSGNPRGRPVIFLHGGPGGGCGPGSRRYFDPHAYWIVVFHQRGCGKSRPMAGSPDADLSVNTTSHLLADIEALRQHLQVQRWTMLGVSWGTTLGLPYAEEHPNRVAGLVLGLVTATSRRDVNWMTLAHCATCRSSTYMRSCLSTLIRECEIRRPVNG